VPNSELQLFHKRAFASDAFTAIRQVFSDLRTREEKSFESFVFLKAILNENNNLHEQSEEKLGHVEVRTVVNRHTSVWAPKMGKVGKEKKEKRVTLLTIIVDHRAERQCEGGETIMKA
jgi:hypothetical protein